jgi:hypothetical protein
MRYASHFVYVSIGSWKMFFLIVFRVDGGEHWPISSGKKLVVVVINAVFLSRGKKAGISNLLVV